MVIYAVEKPISTNVIAGFYWFSHSKDFIHATKKLIRKDARVVGNFYICSAFNELILEKLSIGVNHIESRLYHPLEVGRQIE